MQWISQFALAASIFASIMGAFVMAVLVFRYGFTIPAPSDAGAGPTPTDVLITRVGHAIAGMCFAATAVLAVVGLSLRSPAPAPATAAVAPTPAVVPAESARRGQPMRQDLEVEALELRLAEARSQLARLDGELRSTSTRANAIAVAADRRPARVRPDARPPARPFTVASVRASITRAERTVLQRLGSDPLGRVSARD